MALATGIASGLAGIALWGLHMGLTQGIFAALVADGTPAERRGMAFGVFNLAGGIAMLLASVAAGLLWDAYGPSATFLASAGLTASVAIGTIALQRCGWITGSQVSV